MQLGEVTKETSEQFDVRLVIQKVLVSELLGRHVSHCLLEHARAVTALVHQFVVDHVASVALEILHLVGDDSAIEQVNQPLLNLLKAQRYPAWTEPGLGDGVAVVVGLIDFVEVVVPADVHVLAPEARRTDHIW